MQKPKALLILILLLIGTTLNSVGANWYVSTTGNNSAGHGTSSGDPFLTIGYAITAASAGDVIYVAAGIYSEYLTVNKALTINGANANIAGNGSRGAESKIQNTNGNTVFSIKSDNVIINGFEITAPISNYGIYIGDGSGNYNYSNVSIIYNYIHDVGTQRGSGNVYAIDYYVPNIAATTSTIDISYNYINNIGNNGGTYSLAGHCGGIYFANSTSTGTVNNVSITNNIVTNVKSKAFGKYAWGIVIGTSGTGKLVNPIISNNEISSMAASVSSYVHAIGLEGNTPGAIVSNNKISLTTSQYGVYLTSNSGTGIKINNNSLTNVSKGIYNSTSNSVDGSCNWWGQTTSISGKISGSVSYTPWLISGTDNDLNSNGFQPAGSCYSPCSLEIIQISTNYACVSSSNGSANFSINGLGSGSYSYLWKQGSTIIGTTTSISGLNAATYSITVTDANGCTATGTAIVGTNTLPTGNITGGTSSSVNIAVTGIAPWSGTLSDGTQFSGSTNPISVSVSPSNATTYTIAALADAYCTSSSADLTGSYTINLNSATPVPSIVAGTYNTPQSVTLSTATNGSAIRYTIDGSIPTESNGTIYTQAINITSTLTLKAVSYQAGWANSDVFSGYYVIFIDTDGDAIVDSDDSYPTDSTRAFDNYFPADNAGTLVFEDSWPSKGDYDMNDVVVDYRFKNVTNGQNKLVETFATFTLKATGAGFQNGFGFQLASTDIPSTALQVTGFNIQENFVTVSANGTESNQAKPTIIVFDNAYKILTHPGVGTGINTTVGAPYVTPVAITVHIVYSTDTYTEDQLDIANFNPFIIINKVRGKEVHLPDYEPTTLAIPTYLGTIDDNSDPLLSRYYKTKNNLPWALNLYNNFSYPNEKTEITNAYLHFIDWVISNGNSYTDWYYNTAEGYRNNSNIYVPVVVKK